MKKLNIIVAMTEDYLIGIKEEIPWALYDDFVKNFVPKTKGNPIIMGRKTYNTLKSPLKDRTNIVLSKNIKEKEKREGFIFVDNLYDAMKIAEASPGDTIWCIGGAEIYHLFQDTYIIHEYHITVVREFEKKYNFKDVVLFLPNLSKHICIGATRFKKREKDLDNKRDYGNEYSFDVYIYKRDSFNAPIF